MPQKVVWLLLAPTLAIVLHLVTSVAPDAGRSLPDCPRSCGDHGVEIPYPFGIGKECAWQGNPRFTIDCTSEERAYIGNLEIISISVETSEMRVFTFASHICYDSVNTTEPRSVPWWSLNTTDSPFLISPTRNVFTAVGCDTMAFLDGGADWNYFTNCASSCKGLEEAAKDGDKCTGLGCCQIPIPANISWLNVSYSSGARNSAWQYSPYGDGYLCTCSKGYQGNPYIRGLGECANINECDLRQSNQYGELYPCHSDATCQDTDGDYECTCKFWFRGDGKSKEGCNPIFPAYAIAILAIFFAIVVAACLGFVLLHTRKQRKFFKQHGGDLLRKLDIKIFTKRELKKITRNYRDRIGGGFFGDVYKGIIDAGTQAQEVAVKCTVARKVARLRQKELRRDEVSQQEQDNSWKDQFVREITFQFQIKHPNVVRLIGCCLETDIPILVFEFVRLGSLHDRLHPADKKPCTLPLMKRLDIAVGAAEALSHMHSLGGYNHVHGDIKTANILDDNLNAKVSDFGSSMLLSFNMYAVGVAADGIYADPVYYKTGRFTVKSDVYSFGVVLLELITGRTARCGENSLVIDFEKSCKDEEKRRSMYDPYILSDDDPLNIKLLDMIGALAVECLSGDEDKRPTMAEVVVELNKVRSMAGGGLCSEASENTPLIDGAS